MFTDNNVCYTDVHGATLVYSLKTSLYLSWSS